MDIAHALVVISVFLSIGGSYAYIRDTLKGTTKPNRVSFFLWSVSPLIGTAAALSAHADIWATVRIFLAGFMPLLIFIASFINPKSYWKLTWFDVSCGACSVFALILWGITSSPILAILFSALGDGFASIPTLIKAWKYPETETKIAYVTSLVGVILVLPSIPVWNIQNSAFQVYLLIANTLLLIAVYRKQLLKLLAKYNY